MYFVNVERGNHAVKLQSRNINVSFNNNSNVAIDLMVFVFYSDELLIDVLNIECNFSFMCNTFPYIMNMHNIHTIHISICKIIGP